MVFFHYLGRQAGQCAIDARAIHDASLLYKIHLRGY
jgi:hypothetical protein